MREEREEAGPRPEQPQRVRGVQGVGGCTQPRNHRVGGARGAQDPHQRPARPEPVPSLGADGSAGWVLDSSRSVGSYPGLPLWAVQPGCPGGARVTQGQGSKTWNPGIRQSHWLAGSEEEEDRGSSQAPRDAGMTERALLWLSRHGRKEGPGPHPGVSTHALLTAASR